MKKVLMVAYTNYLTDARPRREAEALAARGDEVDFVALAEQNYPKEEIVNGVRVLRLSMERYRGAVGLRYILSYLSFFIRASIKVVSLYLVNRYDVLHIHTMPDFLVFVAIVPKLMGARVILDVHDMMPELYMSKFGIGEKHWLIKLIKLQELASTRFADRVICVHHPHKEVLMGRGVPADRITILLNVPDPNVFGESVQIQLPENESPKFVYHGTIAKRLGLDLAIEAFSRVIQVVPDAKFEIYGDGDFANEIEKKIRILNINDAVLFSKKFFRVEEIPRLVQGAVAGIIPYRQGLATEYALPVKLFEYAYLGIPVVAPKLKTIQYYFNDDSIAFYDAGDVVQLSDLLVMLWKNPKRRYIMSMCAQERIRTLSWHSIKKSLFEIMDY